MSARPDPRLPATVPQALGRLRVALNDAFAQAGKELDLSPQQAELLCAAMRPRAVGEIARMLRCDRSNISRLVDRAATRGLLSRRAEQTDGRLSMIELTPTGQGLATRFIKRLESLTRPLIAGWDEERQQSTVATLNALSGVLEAETRPRRPETAPLAPQSETASWFAGRRR